MYKIKFDDEQIQKIYSISDKPATQSRLMSILSYVIKYTDKTTNTLTKSISKLYKMYLRYHNKITRSYFYTLIAKLKEENLLSFNLVEDKKEDEKEDKKELPETVENALLESYSVKPNDLIINHNNYTYTSYTSNDVKVSALELVEEVFQDLKIKSRIVRSMVVSKLRNTVLDAAGAINYIIEVVTEKTEQYNSMKVNYAKAIANTKYSKTKNTYSASGRTFNNFEGRKYDYNSLEKKLLGWND